MAGEWLKLRKQRSFIWATFWASAIVMAFGAMGGDTLRDGWDNDSAGSLGQAASAPSAGILLAGAVFGIGLCVWLAREFVSGSNDLTLLAVPRRSTLFSARLALIGILSVVFGGWVALIGTGTAVLFVGLGRMSPVLSGLDFWGDVAATLMASVSIALLSFAAATLTRRSLSAVGIVVMLSFGLVIVGAGWSVAGGPAVVSHVLKYIPGSLISVLTTAPEPDAITTFSPPVAAMLLAVWNILFLSGAALRFARHE